MPPQDNPYTPPPEHAVVAPDPPRRPYRQWSRPRTYLVFCFGMTSISFVGLFMTPHMIMFGWFALGFGIPAFKLANREIAEYPEAAEVNFIKYGRACGKWGMILGPILAVLWVVILFVGTRVFR